MDLEQNQSSKQVKRTQNPSLEYFSGFKNLDFDKLSKVIIIVTGVLYILGLVTINRYLYSFGLAEFSLINARYIYTGVIMITLPVLTIVCCLLIIASLGGAIDVPITEDGKAEKSYNKMLTGMKISRAIAILVIPCILLYLIPFAGQTLSWSARLWRTILLCGVAFWTGAYLVGALVFATMPNPPFFSTRGSVKFPILSA